MDFPFYTLYYVNEVVAGRVFYNPSNESIRAIKIFDSY